MLASGCAGLGYQVVWTQQCALWLGHEAAAVLAVVTAFFAGIALGALVLGRVIEGSARPQRWYAACELVIAAWSCVLALGLHGLAATLSNAIGPEPGALRQWVIAFGGAFILLLPATAAMGATLPAMERVVAAPSRRGDTIAALYGLNTAGAVLGVLATAFWLLPQFGLLRTAAACALLNVACAAGAWRLPAAAAPPAAAAAVPMSPPALPLARLAATGLLGIGYEVLVVRVLSQVAQNTVYTYALLLAVYLVGTTLGAAACTRWLTGPRAPARDTRALRNGLLAATATACLLGGCTLWAAEALRDSVQAHAPGMAGALAAEALLAGAAFALPTVAMGALFSLLAAQAREAGIGLSAALGANTLGAAIAPVVFGVLLLPALGAKVGVVAVAAGYLVLRSPRDWRPGPAWVAVAAAAGVAFAAPPLVFIDVPEGGRVVSYSEGAVAAVSVVEDAQGVSRLRIDNRQQEGSSASGLADGRQALLPLLLHPAPRRVLFLGLGTGVTASAAAADPGLQVDVAELLPEVIQASAHFTPPGVRLHAVAADARRYVRASAGTWDLVVSDNFHPARSGSGSLYTVEHFQAVRARLNPGGLFCQWLPLHQLDLPALRSIVRSYLAAYPQGQALLATNSLHTPVLGLVGGTGRVLYNADTVRRRLQDAAPALRLPAHGLDDEYAVLGSFVAGPRALEDFAGNAPLNTDDRPVVAYLAPRITYAPDTTPASRLLALLQHWQPQAAEVLAAQTTPEQAARVAAYWQARSRFIAAGERVRPSPDVREMLAQVRMPLMDVLRTSPDFRPAYDPLLGMAGALAARDATAARALLQELQVVQPARPEAGMALQRLVEPLR